MRRDVFISNDSGALSVVAADAVDAIVQDGRRDDLQFVTSYRALLQELYGDDSVAVRVVVDEPLTVAEEAEWLARSSWRIDATDGRLLVMGGFDPDVLVEWLEQTGGAGDSAGVALIESVPRAARVDLYAHIGSMNGRRILEEAGRAIGVDTSTGRLIGFVIHVTPATESPGVAPANGWFPLDTNQRLPSADPEGILSEAPLRDGVFHPSAVPAAVARPVEIIEVWSGDPLRPVEGEPVVVMPPGDAYLLYWIAALASDSPLLFELWVTAPKRTPWAAPSATDQFVVKQKGPAITALGPAADASGWELWWGARAASQAIAHAPDGSTIDFATAPRQLDSPPAVGRLLFSGDILGGMWEITEASPRIGSQALRDALDFVRPLAAAHDDERSVLIDATREFRTRFARHWAMDER